MDFFGQEPLLLNIELKFWALIIETPKLVYREKQFGCIFLSKNNQEDLAIWRVAYKNK